jgi:hypothetical protein
MSQRSGLARVLLALGTCAGCTPPPAIPPPAKPAVALAIHRPSGELLVFSGEAETPGTAYEFDGAPGSVRVTMEISGTTGSPSAHSAPPIINDVLFKAEGRGRIAVAFKRPWPEHSNGRVTITCDSGGEESSASFEPELWSHLPGAIVTLEPAAGESNEAVNPGKELVLSRYTARNIPRDLRLTFKAVFTRDPLPPRTKAEPLPSR